MAIDLHEVGNHWGDLTVQYYGKKPGIYWFEAGAEINKRMNRNISGDPDCDYTTYTLNTYFRDKLPMGRCLSLGSGTGKLERSLARQGAFQQCDGYDVAEMSLEKARSLARDEGFDHIRYFMADINKIELPEKIYDSVWIQGAMHHFDALEHVCDQIRRALKPEGLLILNEYIGPNRFQFPERQKEVANLCLQLLPRKYRTFRKAAVERELKRATQYKGSKWFISRLSDKIKEGDLLETILRRIQVYKGKITKQGMQKETINFPTTGDVIAADPSEAVRSEEINPVLNQFFEIIENKHLGGNILQFLLADISGNFSKDDPQAQALLRMLIEIEEAMIACGEFSSDFAYIAARPLK